MVTGILIVLHGLVIILRALPGIEFGDNKALKYLTEDNGVAEVSFKENLGNILKLLFFLLVIIRRLFIVFT